jgi:hypothetical protein
MKIIILSGENKKYNKVWTQKISEALQGTFENIDSFHYHYWDNQDLNKIKIDEELKLLSNMIQEEEEYIICAKTTGVLIALKGMYERLLEPQKCIFIGMPIIWARLNNFEIDKWLSEHYNTEMLIIQKDKDPSMYYEELKEYLMQKEILNTQIIKISGNDMYYEDYETLPNLILDFISDKQP